MSHTFHDTKFFLLLLIEMVDCLNFPPKDLLHCTRDPGGHYNVESTYLEVFQRVIKVTRGRRFLDKGHLRLFPVPWKRLYKRSTPSLPLTLDFGTLFIEVTVVLLTELSPSRRRKSNLILYTEPSSTEVGRCFMDFTCRSWDRPRKKNGELLVFTSQSRRGWVKEGLEVLGVSR